MAQVLVRDLKPATIEKLKRRAKRNGRSLQAELKQIIEGATPLSKEGLRSVADAIRGTLRDRHHSDSVHLLREDRSR
jgi:plasmid stability protein